MFRGFKFWCLAVALCGLVSVFPFFIAGIAPARADGPKAVGLADARVAPTYLAYLRPGATVRYDPDDGMGNCPNQGGFFTDVSAYRWDGTALGPQRTDVWSIEYWRDGKRRVTFDGLAFRNHTLRPVIVAGWCD